MSVPFKFEMDLDDAGLRRMVQTTPEKIRQALSDAGAQMVNEIKASMLPGDYRAYRRPGGRIHYSSRPGNPPAPDTGTLKRRVAGQLQGRFVYQIADNVHYGQYLELGTYKMAARPFMARVVRVWANGKLINLIKERLK